MIPVLLYLAAVVAANLIIEALGPTASVWTAFALIGLTLTVRDRIHDSWSEGSLGWKMGFLILAGAGISYLLNRNVGSIALASFSAFAAAEVVDAVLYHFLRDRQWFERVNGSNVASAMVDSLIFPTLAFGTFLWPIVLGQLAAKIAGGAAWSLLLRPGKIPRWVGEG